MRIRSFGVAVLSILGMLVTPQAASAQGSGFGYVFASPAFLSTDPATTLAWQGGGGGELWARNSISLGGELGFFYQPATVMNGPGYHYSTSAFGAALVSANASRHFRVSTAHTDVRPFVTGGISAGTGGAGWFNAGGGADWWMKPRSGLRVEVRDQFGLGFGGAHQVFLAVRVGIVLR